MCIIHKSMILEYVQIRNLKNIIYEILAFPSVPSFFIFRNSYRRPKQCNSLVTN